MESEWELDRIRLFQVWQEHGEWTKTRLGHELKRSLSWVKKWLKRFGEAERPSLEMFKSQSRAPHHRPRQIVRAVRDAILDLRDQLREKYGRVVGPKTILYHLNIDASLKPLYVPQSTRTIWQVLKDGGRIPTRLREHYPLQRPEPMQDWEMDFGQLGDAFEFLSVVDRGTSILVDTQTQPHYNAETALMAVAHLLSTIGLPLKLRFDNDPRFVGNWLTDGYPSPLMRFLLCLGVELMWSNRKPYHKPCEQAYEPSNTNVYGQNILKIGWMPWVFWMSIASFTTGREPTSPWLAATVHLTKPFQPYRYSLPFPIMWIRMPGCCIMIVRFSSDGSAKMGSFQWAIMITMSATLLPVKPSVYCLMLSSMSFTSYTKAPSFDRRKFRV